MKLQAGNPNLKKAATRVNPHATLESFTPTTGDKVHARQRTGFVPMPKAPDAVPPPQMSVWARESYVPEKSGYQRPGADDHLKYKSRGF